MTYVYTYIHSGTITAPITNAMATVTLNGLACGVTYTITAGGTLNGQLVGPRSPHGTITAGPCPPKITSTIVPTTSMTGKEDKICRIKCYDVINYVSLIICNAFKIAFVICLLFVWLCIYVYRLITY